MNTEKILKFADFIESLGHARIYEAEQPEFEIADDQPGLFNMATFGFDAPCGTVACMAGWVPHVFAEEFTDYERAYPNTTHLIKAFGIEKPLAHALAYGRFMGPEELVELDSITSTQAANALRQLARGETQDWELHD